MAGGPGEGDQPGTRAEYTYPHAHRADTWSPATTPYPISIPWAQMPGGGREGRKRKDISRKDCSSPKQS